MNILHISSPNSWRGGERQVYYLINGLKETNHSIYLMSPKCSTLQSRINLESDHCLIFKKGAFSLFYNIRALTRFCIQNKIDIINGHDSHAHSLLWMAYRFGGLKAKSVVTRRLLYPVKGRSISKYNFSKIEKIICISEAVKKAIYPDIKNASRLEVIHSAINVSPSPQIIKNQNSNSKFVIGYVAAFTKEKDHNTFIKTASYLLKQHPEINFEFILAGSGPLLESIKAKSTDLLDHVHFTGFIEDLDQVYTKMDILLHTSTSEALGTSILDAMKYGLPVIATQVGGIPEIVTEGKNGYLCEPGDYKKMANNIVKLATSKGLYAAFSTFSTKNIKNFDTSLMVQKTLNLYTSLIK